MLKSEIPSPRRQPCIGAPSPIQQHASPIHDSILDTLDLLALRGGCSKVPSELKITRRVEERAQVPRIRSWGARRDGARPHVTNWPGLERTLSSSQRGAAQFADARIE